MVKSLASQRTEQSPKLDNLRRLVEEYHEALEAVEAKRRAIGNEVNAVKPWYSLLEMEYATGLNDTTLGRMAQKYGVG